MPRTVEAAQDVSGRAKPIAAREVWRFRRHMVTFLAFDLALGALLLLARVGRATPADDAGRWFAAVLGAGLLTLCAPRLAALPPRVPVDVAFVLCNAAGMLIGPCLIRYAKALTARHAGTSATNAGAASAAWIWAPFGLLLLVYATAALFGTAPRALELWVATAKAVSLVGGVAVAVTTLRRGRCASGGRSPRDRDLRWLVALVVLGLTTLPAALVGGEALAQWVHEMAVLPVLGVTLWWLTCQRLRGDGPPPPAADDRSSQSAGTRSAPVKRPIGADASTPSDAADTAILAAVWHAFVADLDAARGWLDPDFGLDEAARRMGIRRHLLSEAINRHADGGFAAVVNAQRLAAFRAALVAAPAEESVLEIGLRCGFGSKATLQRLVKREFGLSPGALRRLLAPTE